MVSTAPVSKTKRSIFASAAARRAWFGTWALVIAWTCLGPWPYPAGAVEISALSASKGFAGLVARVKPAVIAVTVRLEREADFSKSNKMQAPRSRSHSPRTHSPIATCVAAAASPHLLRRSKWPWGRAFSYPRTDMR
jgi:hypothetical protein